MGNTQQVKMVAYGTLSAPCQNAIKMEQAFDASFAPGGWATYRMDGTGNAAASPAIMSTLETLDSQVGTWSGSWKANIDPHGRRNWTCKRAYGKMSSVTGAPSM